MASFLWALSIPALVLALGWLAKRDARIRRHWGEGEEQSNIITGAQIDAPRIIPVEPPAGLSLNGAPTDDTRYEEKCGHD